jgi:hypothetical protein
MVERIEISCAFVAVTRSEALGLWTARAAAQLNTREHPPLHRRRRGCEIMIVEQYLWLVQRDLRV